MSNDKNSVDVLEYGWIVNKLVSVVANSFPNLERDDLIQAGRLGLLQAAEKYDPNKGAKFSTYAWTYAHFMIKKEAEFQLQTLLTESLDKTMYEENSDTMGAFLEATKCVSEIQTFDTQELFANQANSHLFDKLSKQEFQILKMVYGRNDSSVANLNSIAKELGVNRYKAKEILESAKTKIGGN